MIEFRKNKKHFLEQVKKHISKDRLDKAMNLLIQFSENQKLDSEAHNKILLLSNQLENIRHREILGLGVPTVEKNNITKRLLDLVSHLQEYQAINSEKNEPDINGIQIFKQVNKKQIGIYTVGIGSLITIALLLGLNAVLSILIGILIIVMIWKFEIEI